MLHEMGIQQWQRRTALPSSVPVEPEAQTNDEFNSAQAVERAPFPADAVTPAGGFAGSLKDALQKPSDQPKVSLPVTEQTLPVTESASSVSESTEKKPSATLADVSAESETGSLENIDTSFRGRLASAAEELAVNERSSTNKEQSSEQAESNDVPASKKIVPLDISDLLGDSDIEVSDQDGGIDADAGHAFVPDAEPNQNLDEMGGFFTEEELVMDASLLADGGFLPDTPLENEAEGSLPAEGSLLAEGSLPVVSSLSAEGSLPAEVVAKAALSWSDLHSRLETNEYCPSCGWGNSLLGAGEQAADWMFLVDAPNSREIEAKSLFVGRDGQLFDAILHALKLTREQVYCTSVFKCAPTDDLSVTPSCDHFLQRQIELVAPRVLIAFGEFSAQTLLKSNAALDVMRSSKQHCYQTKTPIIVTHSPQDMLKNSALKSDVWHDLKKAIRLCAD